MGSETRSVFLYGNPTQVKRQAVEATQKAYTDLINHFITILASNSQYFLPLLLNNKKSPLIRNLEKQERYTHQLGSAYGQNAIDKAVTELHNHLTRIRHDFYGVIVNQYEYMVPYIQSIAVFHAVLLHGDEVDAVMQRLDHEYEKKKQNDDKIAFYQSLLSYFESLRADQRQQYSETIRMLFTDRWENRKLPYVRKAPLQLDTRICRLEEADHIQADYVLSVKLLGCKDRVELPVSTSSNSLRRMKQYDTGSPMLTIQRGNVRVIVPFEKRINERETNDMVVVDAGITDLLYSSDTKAYGTFSGMSAFYEKTVEPKLKTRSSLRNVMRQYQRELRHCTEEVRKTELRKKIANIANNLHHTKGLDHLRRQYAQEVSLRLHDAIHSFLKDIGDRPVTVAMEALDIDEFDRSKRENKRDSSWIRGQLLTTLQHHLRWKGIPYTEVEPAYTSQMCPVCSNVAKDNRHYKMFECTVCGHRDDADHNASVNIRNRVEDEAIRELVEKYKHNEEKKRKAIKDLLMQRHRRYLEIIPVAI